MAESNRGNRFVPKLARNMAYKIAFTETGRKTYDECIEYILFELGHPQAARKLLEDIDMVLESLQMAAASFALCDDEDLRSHGLRKVHLRRHSYKIFYRVDGDNVYIEYVLHDKRDYKNIIR